MDSVPLQSHDPKHGDSTPITERRLAAEWRASMAEVIHAQQSFIEMERDPAVTPGDWRSAWLRLWHAQEHLRDVDHSIAAMSSRCPTPGAPSRHADAMGW
jgi:hypothetical protein